MRGEGRKEKGGGGKRGGDERGRSRREGRGGLSGNVAEEAFCLKSAPVLMAVFNWPNISSDHS